MKATPPSLSSENVILPGTMEAFDTHRFIIIKNAWQNNLKNIDLAIPRNKLIAITGVSGSGKSSLAFETLYEEGRRRYVESLSAYVRQFLGKMRKPNVDYIKGLPPAICIEQKRSTSNARSTVGTVTEIYHYLKLLYARLGKTYSPVSGKEVKRHSADDVVDYILSLPLGTRLRILAPLQRNGKRDWKEELSALLLKGYTRILINQETRKIQDLLEKADDPGFYNGFEKDFKKGAWIIIDRLILENNIRENRSRISDSVETALFEGHCYVMIEVDEKEMKSFSCSFEEDGIVFEDPTPDLFSFNSPHGACPVCGGFGEILGIDEAKVIPDRYKSVMDGAVICWEGEKMGEWRKEFVKNASKQYNFPIFKPYNELNRDELDILWNGRGNVEGINQFFAMLESNTYKVHYRIILSRYKGRTTCRSCFGSRLRREALYVQINKHSIGDLVNISISQLKTFFDDLTTEMAGNKVSERILLEINKRLQLMVDIGLGYLTLNRTSRSLSGGELQRIQLIYSLGSTLTGSLYILDEPSIGLHPRDTFELIKILVGLRNLGNTVLVVEHDEDIIRAADEIIDLGPAAGHLGGQLIYQGPFSAFPQSGESYTLRYLKGDLKIPVPEKRKNPSKFIQIRGAEKYNLKNIDVDIPVEAITVITGVSGSGKTTLVREVVYESLKNDVSVSLIEPVNCRSVVVPKGSVRIAEFVGQEGIDRSKRSNPVTYLKIFDYIRDLFAQQKLAKVRGYTPAYFSFNVDGGRCDECKGDGFITVEMQFVADMHLLCESCKGKRYRDDILEVTVNGKNIDQVLSMTVIEAIGFFHEHPAIVSGLQPLVKAGLDYLTLGQPTSTLSGGEAQRLKLASYLAQANKVRDPVLFIFDEPTTGLHWHDISKLLDSFRELIKIGHSILIIEHNMEVIKSADYIIDLGPEGGDGGGRVLFQGKPEDLLQVGESYTAKYLRNKISC